MRGSTVETLRRWRPGATPGQQGVWPSPRISARRAWRSPCSCSLAAGDLGPAGAARGARRDRRDRLPRRGSAEDGGCAVGPGLFRCQHRAGALDARDRRPPARAPRVDRSRRDQPFRDPPGHLLLTRSRRDCEQLRARGPRRIRGASARRRAVDGRGDAGAVHDRAAHVRRQLPVRATHLRALLPGLPAKRPDPHRVPRDDAAVRGHAGARSGDRRADRAARGIRARAARAGRRRCRSSRWRTWVAIAPSPG